MRKREFFRPVNKKREKKELASFPTGFSLPTGAKRKKSTHTQQCYNCFLFLKKSFNFKFKTSKIEIDELSKRRLKTVSFPLSMYSLTKASFFILLRYLK